MSYTVILPSMVQQQVTACTWGNGSASSNSVRMWPCLQIPFAVGMKGGGGGGIPLHKYIMEHIRDSKLEYYYVLCTAHGRGSRRADHRLCSNL